MTVRRIARWAAISLASASIAMAGVAAAEGHGGTDRPGKGCGDNNHVHYNEGDCKSKDHGHHGDGHGDHGDGHRGHS